MEICLQFRRLLGSGFGPIGVYMLDHYSPGVPSGGEQEEGSLLCWSLEMLPQEEDGPFSWL
jgi:hypothetical protein